MSEDTWNAGTGVKLGSIGSKNPEIAARLGEGVTADVAREFQLAFKQKDGQLLT